MKRKFTFLWAALGLLALFILPTAGWGQSYDLIKSVDDITDDNYVIAAKVGDKYYALSNTFSTQISGAEIEVSSGSISTTNADGYVVTIEKDNNNRISISNGTNYLNCKSSGTSFETGTTAYMHDVSYYTTNGNGFLIKHQTETRGVIYRAGTTNKFGNYSTGNINGTEYYYVQLFKYNSGGSSTTYSVTYKPGSGATGNNVVDSDISGTYTVRANDGQNGNPDFSKTGHSFSCWNDGTDDVNVGAEITVSSNITLTAQWTANTHTVTLPTADTYGEYTMDVASPVAYGTTVNLTYTPATGYENYTASWTVNSEPISGSSFTMPDEAVTVGVSVAAYVQPTEFNIALNNTAFGCEVGNNATEQSFTINNTLVVAGCSSSASNKTYYASGHVRFYADSYLKITAPTGYNITKTIFTADGTWNGGINANTGSYTDDTKTWEGETDQLDFSFDAQNRIASIAITLALPPSVAIPTFDPEGGAYATPQNVTISTTTPSATIYYTTDGTTPTSSSTEYTAAIPVSATTTIKAIAVLGSDVSTVASATYTILPIEHAGTETDPYTVADARNAIDVNGTVSDAYVTGIISQVDSYSSTYNSITYWISSDGETTSDQLEVYGGKGLNNTNFSSINDVVVGATVVVKGNLKKYGSIYEFDKDNYLTSYAAPSNPSVTPSSFLIEATANTGLSGTLNVAYANITTVAADVWFCNAAGNEAATYSWIVTNVTSENNIEYLIEENTGAARTAYFKVWAYDDGMNEVYSDLVTVTQAAPVIDYSTLPFNWEGGTKSELAAVTGVTTYGLGNDYAASNAPYRVRMDGTGDYILVKTDSQPGKVAFGIKNYGSSTGTVIAVQESSNGSDFTLVEELTITCSQNKTQEFETTNSFSVSTRYVRIYDKTHNSNFGVGPIRIAKYASFEKVIAGYGTGSDKWYLIASPVVTAPTDVTNMLVGDNTNPVYDLYSFDQSEDEEWRNYRVNTFNLEPGQGYLYARKEGATLTISGSYFGNNGVVDLNYDANAELKGWNLIGNPFANPATLNMPYYKMNDDGDGFTAKIEDLTNPVGIMEGVFVQATAVNQKATFTAQTSKGGRQSGIAKANLNVIGANGNVIDNAIVRFDEGQTLEKFMLHADGTKIFFTEDHKDYAIVRGNAQGQMPVNFKAAADGTYTISVETENLDVNYLHLIDNKTGMDVDLLATPSYTFEGKRTDYASRFRLVFDANAGNNETNEEFAFISDGNIIVNGTGTVQLIDILGRQMFSHEVNSAFRIQNSEFAPGVYVLQLVNGNNVKTQKIVIK